MKHCLWTLLLLVLCFSCNRHTDLKKDVVVLQSHPVILPLDSMACFINGRDTIVTVKPEALKLIVYVDSMTCMSCSVKKFHLWDDFLERMEVYGDDLKCCFIFCPASGHVRSLELDMATYSPDYPIYVDTLGLFERMNPHIPSNPMLHTFLLDGHDAVLLAGDPFHNQRIGEIFWKIVEERLGKR